MYRAELENKALPMEDKAVEALEKALDKSFELNIYNSWTLKAEDEIDKVRPGAFGDIRNVTYRGSEVFATAPVLADASAASGSAPAEAAPENDAAKPAADKPADKATGDKPAAKPADAPAEEGAGGN